MCVPRAFPIASHLKVPAAHFHELASAIAPGRGRSAEQRRGNRPALEALYTWWIRPRAPLASRPSLRAGRAALPTPPRDSTGRRFWRRPPARHARCMRSGRAGLPTHGGSRRPERPPPAPISTGRGCATVAPICRAGRLPHTLSPYPVGVSFRHVSLPPTIGLSSAAVSQKGLNTSHLLQHLDVTTYGEIP